MTNPRKPLPSRKRTPYQGLTARKIDQSSERWNRPSPPSTTNQTAVTGPNRAAIRWVPRAWTMNRPTRMAAEISST